MRDYHADKQRYFDMQYMTARDYVIPFIEDALGHSIDWCDKKVLEIGCGEAGVLKAFAEAGAQCMGIELVNSRIETAKSLLGDFNDSISFTNSNIYDIDPEVDLPHKFDVIILKDVIEHIPKQEVFMKHLKGFLSQGGVVFFAFPPWQMPFGGHQQIAQSKVVSYWPYLHLLPKPIYKAVLKAFRTKTGTLKELMELVDTSISIERFEKICRKLSYKTLKARFYLLNPIYKLKFGLEPKEQYKFINRLGYIRNYLTTCAYYLVTADS